MKNFLKSLLNLVPWVIVLFLIFGKQQKTGELGELGELGGVDLIASELSSLAAQEITYKNSNPKYQHIKEFLAGDIKYRVDEYVTPKGEVGYQIYAKKFNGSEMSTGTGIEAKDRSFDWTVVNVTST